VGGSKGRSCDRGGIRGFGRLPGILKPWDRRLISRAALSAGASLVAIGAFAAPVEASCAGSNLTISTPQTSTVRSNGGNITIGSGGTIGAKVGITLLSAPSGSSAGTINNTGTLAALTNSGAINGGAAVGKAGLTRDGAR
jgi:hypothetical protein